MTVRTYKIVSLILASVFAYLVGAYTTDVLDPFDLRPDVEAQETARLAYKECIIQNVDVYLKSSLYTQYGVARTKYADDAAYRSAVVADMQKQGYCADELDIQEGHYAVVDSIFWPVTWFAYMARSTARALVS